MLAGGALDVRAQQQTDEGIMAVVFGTVQLLYTLLVTYGNDKGGQKLLRWSFQVTHAASQ